MRSERRLGRVAGLVSLATLLSRLLGLDQMMPATIERRHNGAIGALSWWVDDVLMDEAQRERTGTAPPGGSLRLVREVKASTRIPVLGHADGICHVFLDASADAAVAAATGGTSLATTSLVIIVGAVLQTSRQVEALLDGPRLQQRLDAEREAIAGLAV